MKNVLILLILWAALIVLAWINLPIRFWISSAALWMGFSSGWLETINAIWTVFFVSIYILFGLLFFERGMWVLGWLRRSGVEHPPLWQALARFVKRI